MLLGEIYDGTVSKLSSEMSRETFRSNKSYNLTIQIHGNTFNALVERRVYSSVIDNSIPSGGAGIAAYFVTNNGGDFNIDFFEVASNKTNASTPTATDTAIIGDDFNQELNAKWKVIQPGLATLNGQINGEPIFGPSGMLVYDFDGTDYTIKTNVQGDNFAILFRTTLTETKDRIEQGYAFICGVGGCFWVKFMNGTVNKLSTEISREAFRSNSPHNLTIQIHGNTFDALVERHAYSSITDDSIPSGGVGIAAYFVTNNGGDFNIDFFEVNN